MSEPIAVTGLVPEAWDVPKGRPVVLICPPDSTLPAGFPFSKIVITSPREALRTVVDLSPDSVTLLSLSEESAQLILDVRTVLEITVLSLVGGELRPEGFWNLLTSPLQEVAIQEIMETRSATPTYHEHPAAKKQLNASDLAQFDTSLEALKKANPAWDQTSSDSGTDSEGADD